jgi:superfamily II DNA or RNA helicase
MDGSGSEHLVGRPLEVHTRLAPRIRRARTILALLIAPDAHRAFGWAAEIACDADIDLLVLPAAGERGVWRAALENGEPSAVLHSADGASPAATDGAARLADALTDGRVRWGLLDGDEELLAGRGDDVLALTDEDGRTTLILRDAHGRPDGHGGAVERITVLDGADVPGVVGPIMEELAAAVTLLDDRPAVTAAGTGLAGVELRDYQRDAVEAWVAAGMRGVLSMATGSGKTMTAIACAQEVRTGSKDGLVIVVTAPLVHLVEQWADEFERLLDVRAVRCHTSRATWLPVATTSVNLVRSGSRPLAVLAATHDTAALPDFSGLIAPVRPDSLMVIADESHHLDGSRTALMPQQAGRRLGLTATPRADLDADEAVTEYLGPVVTEYPLSRAIADGVLCPYEYLPMPVRLTDDELSEFTRISDLLSSALQETSGRRDRALLSRLVQERADLLDSATGKIGLLAERVEAMTVRHTIIYCSGRDQLAAAQKVCWDRGINAQPFTGEESTSERRRILDGFSSERIPALVAIRCLDEGVDVPPARRAIMLRSSANPTQSVQRRGRLLRRHEGKTHAVIEDLVAVGTDGKVTAAERDRIELFAADAMNVATALAGLDLAGV